MRGCLLLFGLGCALALVLLLAAGLLGNLRRPQDGLGSAFAFGHRVGLIELDGEITSSDDFVDELKRLEDDPRVSALVVRVNSPGGEVVATQEIHHALERFRHKTGQPVVASLGSLAASGGYYAICGADRIVTEPGTLTGSIGVIFDFPELSELLKKIGVRMEVIKSGPKKDFGAYWRPLTDEERAMLQGIVGDVYDQFTEAVAQGRKLPLDRVRSLADGRVLSGRQAVEASLADTLGYEEDAVHLAARLAGLSPETPPISKRKLTTPIYELLRRYTGELGSLIPYAPRLLYR